MNDATRPMGSRAARFAGPHPVITLSSRTKTYDSGPVSLFADGAIVAGGKIRILHDVAHGAGGTTYKAEEIETGRLLALKVLEGKYEDRADAEPRLFAEARFATALGHHAHIVQPICWGYLPEGGDRAFMAMEFVEGPTLAAYVDRTVPVLEKYRVLRDLAGVLAELHAEGIVHRDVKPDNVMLANLGGRVVAKLMDFGLAGEATRVRTSGGAELTGVHDRPGTKHYMAPEQCLGAPVTPAFDVYALGVTAYELFCGAPPWGSNSPVEVVLRKCDPAQPSFSLSRLQLELPAEVDDIVDRALSFAPDARPSAAEFRDVMSALVSRLELEPGAVTRRPLGDSDAVTTLVPRWPAPVRTEVARFVPRAELLLRIHRVDPEPERTAAPEPRRGLGGRRSIVFACGLALALVATASIARWLEARDGGPADEVASPAAGIAPASAIPDAVATPTDVPTPAPSNPAMARPSAAAVVEPEGTVPAAEVETPKKPRARPSSVPAAPAWQTDACRGIRARAESTIDRDPAGALGPLADARCWESRTEHRRLRVRALAGARRYEDCVRVGQSSKDPEVASYVELCKAKSR